MRKSNSKLIDLQDLGKAFLVEYLTGPLGPGIEKPSKMPG